MGNNDYIFSYAENAEGRIVHVDDVPNGKECGCHCPHCGEPLVARQGEKYSHGFAHHSVARMSNLKICYAVTLYKLAEQFVLRNKRIIAPSYYGIYKPTPIEFENVKVDSRYERIDKQPDVIAISSNGDQYIIEFIFRNAVFHKHPINLKNTNCIEIDLSDQTLDTLDKFLSSSPTDAWRWINNDIYFNRIVDTYRKYGVTINIIDMNYCEHCDIWEICGCTGLRSQETGEVLTIENNGKEYRLCKSEVFNAKKIEIAKQREEEKVFQREIQEMKDFGRKKRLEAAEERFRRQVTLHQSDRSCFACENNLVWANKVDGLANCGCWRRLKIPQRHSPSVAETCTMFKLKE